MLLCGREYPRLWLWTVMLPAEFISRGGGDVTGVAQVEEYESNFTPGLHLARTRRSRRSLAKTQSVATKTCGPHKIPLAVDRNYDENETCEITSLKPMNLILQFISPLGLHSFLLCPCPVRFRSFVRCVGAPLLSHIFSPENQDVGSSLAFISGTVSCQRGDCLRQIFNFRGISDSHIAPLPNICLSIDLYWLVLI